MSLKIVGSLLGGTALALVVGCGGSSSVSSDEVRITIQARYEKRDLGGSGFGGLVSRPARYAYAEVVGQGGHVIASDHLGSDGTGWIDLPRGTAFQVKVQAQVEVPNNPVDNSFCLRGSVKRAFPASTYTDRSDFNNLPNWVTTSAAVEADADGTLAVTALESTSEAGAFAIADQMVAFAQQVQALEPSLRLPNLHAFWYASGSDATFATYPAAAWVQASGGDSLLKQDSGRTVFQHEVRWAGPNDADRGADAYNDGVLQETFARLLLADYSLQSTFNDGSDAPDAIVRRDSDNAYASPWDTSALEPTMAWTAGFATFLGSAFRNDPTLREVASNGTVSTFRLDTHSNPLPSPAGEFVPGAVARSLWGIWKNGGTFNGSQAGLQTMYNATLPQTATQAYEYGNTPLAAYPTYLNGLKRLAGTAAATPIANELSLENVTTTWNPNATGLWITEATTTFTRNGTFPTYTAGYVYDQNQAKAFKFVQGSAGSKTITLSASGNGLLLELFDTIGLLRTAYATASANGVIYLSSLPVGEYVVRVRVDPYFAYTGSNLTYALTVQ